MAQAKEGSGNGVRILSVVWFHVLPPKYGGQKGTALFNKYLSKESDLACICSRNNDVSEISYPIENSLPNGKWQFLNPFCWRKIFQAAKRHQTSHIILEYPYHGIAAFLAKKFLKVTVVLHEHNIEYLRFREQGKWWWGLLYHFEKWVAGSADFIFFKTSKDKLLATKYFKIDPVKAAVVPFGIERKSFDRRLARDLVMSRHGLDADAKILLFAGTLDYQPNAEAVKAIYHKIVPELEKLHPDCIFIVCGRNKIREFAWLNQLDHRMVIRAGEVEDIGTYFAAADVFVDPVTKGGGIQSKVLDALSFHTNVACFASKAEEISYAENKLFTAEDGNWEDLTRSINSALTNTSNTPEEFFDHYEWRNITRYALNKILESCGK